MDKRIPVQPIYLLISAIIAAALLFQLSVKPGLAAINGHEKISIAADTCQTTMVTSGSDDGEESSGGGVIISAANLQTYASSFRNYWGLRFQGVEIPRGATITQAYLTLRAAERSTTFPNVTFWGQATDNPAGFTTPSTWDISLRPTTVATANWAPTAWEKNNDYTTSSLVAILQEIVNRPGWAPGQAITLIGRASSSANIQAVSRDHASGITNAPKLTVCTNLVTLDATLHGFITRIGTPSSAQTYHVSGVDLSGALNISAPTGFELSMNGINYVSGITLNPVDGVIPATRIYVRLSGNEEGSFGGSGNPIRHESAGAPTRDVAVSGLVTGNGCLQNLELPMAEDTYLRASSTEKPYNYGNSPVLYVNGSSVEDPRRSALLRWNLDAVPPEAVIYSASIKINVTDPSVQTFNLYRLRRTWVEGYKNGAEGSGASWNFYDAGVNQWGTAGAANTSTDREDTNLWDASGASFSTTGSRTVSLNNAGITEINHWLAEPSANTGFIIQNYTASSDYLTFSSREAATPANRPILSLSMCSPTAADITDFRAVEFSAEITLEWETANEASLVGFHIYRSEAERGEKFRLNPEIIPAQHPGEMIGAVYAYQTPAEGDNVYDYWLEVIKQNGSEWLGPVQAVLPGNPFRVLLPVLIR